MAQPKNGLVVMTIAVEHFCRLVAKFRPAMSAAIVAARESGAITSDQAAALNAWLDGLSAICNILKLVTGY